eukprot:Gb_40815 [translate_table: standard]
MHVWFSILYKSILLGGAYRAYHRQIEFQGGSSEAGIKKMDGVNASVIGLAVLLVAWIVFKRRHGSSNQKLKLPPGPPPLPIIGNLHMLGKLPHRKLRELSKKYGPIMFLRLGSVPTVVASSPEMAKDVLKTNDLIFASRPATCVGKNMVYNSTGVGFCPYGPYWRKMRKNGFWKKVFGGDVEGQQGVQGHDSRSLYLAGAFNIGDFLPYLEWMDLQGLRRRQKHIHKTFNDFFESIIQEHVENKSRGHRDFMDVMLELSKDNTMEIKISRDNIKAVIFDILAAGTDTSSSTLEWALSEMLINPSRMKKVQDELESVVGLNRMVEESDLPQLEYLKVVVKETLRLHPPGPLLIPHEAREDCIVGGYNIPRKARIMVNAFALGTDPNLWEDAEKFKPERFIGSPIDVKGQNFEVIPFGSGRRGCPGQPLATTVVEYALAALLHCFDWRLPDGMKAEDLSMTEEFGLTTPRAVHLVAVPTPRLPQP